MNYFRELSSVPKSMSMEVLLENGVNIVFDCTTEKAIGDDGKTYYPVCRVVEDGSAGGSLESLGWSCEAHEEVILEG